MTNDTETKPRPSKPIDPDSSVYNGWYTSSVRTVDLMRVPQDTHPGEIATCGGCDSQWPVGRKLTCHCSRCHMTFSGVTGFDAHQRHGKCTDPRAIGLEFRDLAWRGPEMDDEQKAARFGTREK